MTKLVLVAPGGLMQKLPALASLANIPLVGDLLLQTIAPSLLASHARKNAQMTSVDHLHRTSGTSRSLVLLFQLIPVPSRRAVSAQE